MDYNGKGAFSIAGLDSRDRLDCLRISPPAGKKIDYDDFRQNPKAFEPIECRACGKIFLALASAIDRGEDIQCINPSCLFILKKRKEENT